MPTLILNSKTSVFYISLAVLSVGLISAIKLVECLETKKVFDLEKTLTLVQVMS